MISAGAPQGASAFICDEWVRLSGLSLKLPARFDRSRPIWRAIYPRRALIGPMAAGQGVSSDQRIGFGRHTAVLSLFHTYFFAMNGKVEI